MSFVKKHLFLLLPISASIVLIFLNFIIYLDVSKIGTDAVSWFLPAKGIIQGLGSPYLNYWDTKPSGLILFSTIWLLIFGENINSFRLLHLLLVSVCVFGIMRVYYLVFPKIVFIVLFVFSIVVFLSPRIQTQSLLIETFGMSFVMIALNILLSEKLSRQKRSYWAALFFVIGGQMKESYAFMGLSMLPFFIHTAVVHNSELKKVLLLAIKGGLTVIGTLVSFLLLTNSVPSYRQVIQFIMDYGSPATLSQSIEFPKMTYIYLQYPLIPFLGLFVVAFLLLKYILKEVGFERSTTGKTVKFSAFSKFSFTNYKLAVLFLYALGGSVGFMLQNRFGSHYDAQMVFPIFILITVPLFILYEVSNKLINKKVKGRKLKFIFSATALVFMMLAIFPKKDYFIEYPFNNLNPSFISNKLQTGNKPDYAIENQIMKNTNTTDCIIHVYGWGVGTTYFYSDRKPCSRFFLVNLMPPIFYDEYKNNLIENPPSAIVYSLAGADIDSNRFEEKVFNFPKVLENCYAKDTEVDTLYFPSMKGDELKKCIQSNS